MSKIRSDGLWGIASRVSVARVCTAITGGVFLYAALAKTLNPASASDVIRATSAVVGGWFADEPGIAHVAISVLIAIEAALGIGLLLYHRNRQLLLLSAVLLTVFTAFLVKLVSLPEAVSCGCMAGTPRADAIRLSQFSGIGRNILLITLCVGAYRWRHGISIRDLLQSPSN